MRGRDLAAPACAIAAVARGIIRAAAADKLKARLEVSWSGRYEAARFAARARAGRGVAAPTAPKVIFTSVTGCCAVRTLRLRPVAMPGPLLPEPERLSILAAIAGTARVRPSWQRQNLRLRVNSEATRADQNAIVRHGEFPRSGRAVGRDGQVRPGPSTALAPSTITLAFAVPGPIALHVAVTSACPLARGEPAAAFICTHHSTVIGRSLGRPPQHAQRRAVRVGERLGWLITCRAAPYSAMRHGDQEAAAVSPCPSTAA